MKSIFETAHEVLTELNKVVDFSIYTDEDGLTTKGYTKLQELSIFELEFLVKTIGEMSKFLEKCGAPSVEELLQSIGFFKEIKG